MIQGLEERIKQLESKVNQIVRQGIVTSVYPDQGTVRVQLPDTGNMVSKKLPVLFHRTADNQAYDMPDIGEQVVCLFLPNGLEQGFIIGSPYSAKDPVPVRDQNKKHYRFPDGTWMEYDRARHKLNIHVQGQVVLNASSTVHVTGSTIDLN